MDVAFLRSLTETCTRSVLLIRFQGVISGRRMSRQPPLANMMSIDPSSACCKDAAADKALDPTG